MTREQFFETLKSIYADVQEKAPNEQTVSNVKVEDTVTSEFDVNTSSIKAYIGGQDVTDRVNIQVNKQGDGTTKVSCEFGTVANGKEVHLQIPVQAKDDFIGSNNVLTNQGTPTISYQGRIDGTSYTQKFTDTPAVNVPVRFRVDDGETADVEAGKSIDLSDLAKDSSDAHIMTDAVKNSLDKYSQIEGTLTYQWVDDQGNPVGPSTLTVINQDSRTPPELPSYTVNTSEDDVGKTDTYKLKVTFTPAEVRSETTSKNAVGAGTEEGTAGIRIIQKQEGKVYIKKVIDNYADYQDKLADDEFTVQAASEGDGASEINAEVVLKHNQVSPAILIKEKTVLRISEIVPKEYELTGITIFGGGSEEGDLVTVDKGEEVVITVHNKYIGKAFFHASDTIKNIFYYK